MVIFSKATACNDCIANTSRTRSTRCHKCWFLRNRLKLEEKFLIKPGVVDVTWIHFESDPFSVTCSVCSSCSNRAGALWGSSDTSLTMQKMNKHQESDTHQQAVRELLHDVPDYSDLAPSDSDFKTVLDRVRRAPPGKEGVEGVAKAKKVRKMIWCLAEAHRAMKRR
eukprot:4236629-Pyramimonas_sp.AAC.1